MGNEKTSSKQAGDQVLDQILNGETPEFPVHSTDKYAAVSQELLVVYDPAIADDVMHSRNGIGKDFAKLHKAATTYGYRGASRGKRNGIVDMNPEGNLYSFLQRAIEEGKLENHGLSNNLKPVKVVAHVPNGNRLVGVLDMEEKEGRHKVVIIGIGNYNGRIV